MSSSHGPYKWQGHSLIANAPFLIARQSVSNRLYTRSFAIPSQPPPGPSSNAAASSPSGRPVINGAAVPPSAAAAAAGPAIARAYKPSLVVLAPTFIFTHFTLAWALVPPIYLFLRTSNLSNTLLAGPQGAWFLSRKVPTWIPDTVVDNLVGGIPANQRKASERPTVEELLERLARRGIRAAYNISTSAFSAFKKGGGEEDALARAAIRELRGGLGMEKEEVKEKAGGYRDKIKEFTSKQAQGAVGDIKFGQVRDGVAAWVLVKLLFPVRLPISLMLTHTKGCERSS